MIRQSRERPDGELELFIRSLNKSSVTTMNDLHSDDVYDNEFLNATHDSSMEHSLETLRDDLTTGHAIEQYEVGLRSRMTRLDRCSYC
jgi:hypothetical protein